METKGVVLVLLVLTAVSLSGCMSGGGGDGGNGGGGSAEISFTEEENRIGIQVSNMGSYEAMWVESESFDGGYQINEESTVPSVYIGTGMNGVVGDACFKESHDAECFEGAPDPERFSDFEMDDTIEVYGLSGGENTLVETREP